MQTWRPYLEKLKQTNKQTKNLRLHKMEDNREYDITFKDADSLLVLYKNQI